MITIPVKLLGGLRQGREKTTLTLLFSDDSTVADLIAELESLAIAPDSEQVIISLNGRGIRQFSPEQSLQQGDEVMVFPNISGG